MTRDPEAARRLAKITLKVVEVMMTAAEDKLNVLDVVGEDRFIVLAASLSGCFISAGKIKATIPVVALRTIIDSLSEAGVLTLLDNDGHEMALTMVATEESER